MQESMDRCTGYCDITEMLKMALNNIQTSKYYLFPYDEYEKSSQWLKKKVVKPRNTHTDLHII